MLKYQFLVFHKERDAFLQLVERLGVVHVKTMVKEYGESMDALLKRRTLLRSLNKQFESILDRVETTGEGNGHFPDLGWEILSGLIEEFNGLEKRIPRIKEDLYHIRHFGSYSNEQLEKLKDHGIHFHLFSVSRGKIQKEWRESHVLEELFETPRKNYFVIVSTDPEPPGIKAQAELFPEHSADELHRQLSEAEARREHLARWFDVRKEQVRESLDRSAKETEESIGRTRAVDQMVPMGEGKVFMLTGWVPESMGPDLERYMDKEGYYYRRTVPDPEEKPPILLANRSLGKWFEPITSLFAFPGYHELDLTPFFAPFFLLFFGLCLGDGGYGLLLFIVLLFMKRKVPKKYLSIWKLALALEFAAFILGVLSGTFFGINLIETDVPVLSGLRNYMLDANGLFTFALILGGIQILFGLVLRIINRMRQSGWQYAIAPFGWIVLLSGLATGYIAGFNVWLTWISWAGVALVLLWSSPGDKIGIRIGKGIWELYGISGFFGDLLSYIRLFALGLAGSILGYVVNDISMTIFDVHPLFGPVFGVIMLVVGHTLNIFIATLGAFVHPMRLTFVEFYKNAGFTGGGEAYKPLRQLTPKSE